MSDGSSASTATSDAAASAPQSAESSNAVARSNDPTTDTSREAKQPKLKAVSEPPVDDDPEYDFDGEKLKKSQLKEYRDIAKRQKEFEAASHERMRKAAAQRKELEAQSKLYEDGWQNIEKDPYALFRARGMTDAQIDAIAEQRLLSQMKRAQMSPEEIAAQEHASKTEAELAELRKYRDDTEKKTKQEATAKLTAEYKAHFDKQIATAIEKANLPRTLRSAQEVARVMAEYLAEGEQLDPMIAAQIVRNGYGKEISSETAELAKSNPQALIEMLGPDVVAAIVKSQIKQAQEFEPQKRKTQANNPFQQNKTREAPDFDEVRRQLAAKGF